MGGIFISYRRDDNAATVGRIYDRLIANFGRTAVFKDVDSIPVGVNFRTCLDGMMRQCSVALVVIGPRWLDIANAIGRRLEDPEDVVRQEIEAALRLDLSVVPVLISRLTAFVFAATLPPYQTQQGMGTMMTPDTSHSSLTAALCANCKKRPGDQPTPYREARVQYQTTYAITRGSYRPRSVRKTIKEGTAQLCARCAAGYRRSVALRSLGNKMADVGFLGLIAVAFLYLVVTYTVPASKDGILALLWAIPALLVALIFLIGVLALTVGTLLRGPATRFLRN